MSYPTKDIIEATEAVIGFLKTLAKIGLIAMPEAAVAISEWLRGS